MHEFHFSYSNTEWNCFRRCRSHLFIMKMMGIFTFPNIYYFIPKQVNYVAEVIDFLNLLLITEYRICRILNMLHVEHAAY